MSTRTQWTLTIDFLDDKLNPYSIESWDRPTINFSYNFVSIIRSTGEISVFHERQISMISLVPEEVKAKDDEQQNTREVVGVRLVPLSHDS